MCIECCRILSYDSPPSTPPQPNLQKHQSPPRFGALPTRWGTSLKVKCALRGAVPCVGTSLKVCWRPSVLGCWGLCSVVPFSLGESLLHILHIYVIHSTMSSDTGVYVVYFTSGEPRLAYRRASSCLQASFVSPTGESRESRESRLRIYYI